MCPNSIFDSIKKVGQKCILMEDYKMTMINFIDLLLSLKKADFHSVERNSPAKVDDCYNRIYKWENTDMNFLTNCVFLDESAFDINVKRSRAWSKKGTRAIVTQSTTRVNITRTNTTFILCAVTATAGLITVAVKKPRPTKKRKANGYISSGTVTGH